MIKITKQQLEIILSDILDKSIEYIGVDRQNKEFAFIDLQNGGWIFWPQQFFIDIIKENDTQKQIHTQPPQPVAKLPF